MRNCGLTNGYLWLHSISLLYSQQWGKASSTGCTVTDWAASACLLWYNGLQTSLGKHGSRSTLPPLSCYIPVFGHSDTEETKNPELLFLKNQSASERVILEKHTSTKAWENQCWIGSTLSWESGTQHRLSSLALSASFWCTLHSGSFCGGIV